MKIAVAVVVGVALLGVGTIVSADEGKRPRSELCLEDCNFIYEKCLKREGAKPTGRCDRAIVRCKRDCPPEPIVDSNVPTTKTHEKCVEACRTEFKACRNRPENKQGGTCAAADMRCEKACPIPPPEVAKVPPPSTPAEVGKEPDAPPPASLAPVPPPQAKPKVRAARVEGAAAPAPVAATPAAAAGERAAGSTAPTVRSEAVTPPTTTTTEASAAAHPQNRRGFFGRLGCFFKSCEPEDTSPCSAQCMTAYDECHARESKRGGECNTRLMQCRKVCRDAAPAPR